MTHNKMPYGRKTNGQNCGNAGAEAHDAEVRARTVGHQISQVAGQAWDCPAEPAVPATHPSVEVSGNGFQVSAPEQKEKMPLWSLE